MAEAFCENPDPENATTVHHRNANTNDNRAENLTWMSFEDNMQEYSKRKRSEKNDSEKADS